MILAIYATLFGTYRFCALQAISLALYVIVTYKMTEMRLPSFREMAQADQKYNQKAQDSLRNYETVKYFMAEDHEKNRFESALRTYKENSVSVAYGLVYLNVA